MVREPSKPEQKSGPRAVRARSSSRIVGFAGIGGALVLLTVLILGSNWSAHSRQPKSQHLPVGETLATARLIPTPKMQRPGHLQAVSDPVFKTPYLRVTDPGHQILPGASCATTHCTHKYSSAQAWNADQSLLAITEGCQDFCFLDGQTFKPLFWRNIPSLHDCNWHPVDPQLMICTGGSKIYTWAPRPNRKTVVFASSKYKKLQFGPWTGNPSRDGNRLAVSARDDRNQPVVFAFDIETKTKFPDILLSSLNGKSKYASISPSGRYIYFAQETATGWEPAYVFTVNGDQVQYWPEHHRPGHGDMTIDDDGNDVYIGISKSDPDKYHIIKRRLSDGLITSLAPYGDAWHASTRNINRPGWVFLSYHGTRSNVVDEEYQVPFYREIIALRTDGSGKIRRLVHTRNADHDYRSETHATPSPDGSQVIWSSNWGTTGGPVADYVAKLEWPEPEPAPLPDQ